MKKLTVLFLLLASQMSYAGRVFEGPYPDAPDYFNLLNQYFPKVTSSLIARLKKGEYNPLYSQDDCYMMSDRNRKFLGAPSANGEVLAKKPNPAFWTWYMNCLSQTYLPQEATITYNYIGDDNLTIDQKFVTPEIQAYLDKAQTASITPWLGLWNDVPEAIKLAIAKKVVTTTIDKGIFQDYHETDEEFARKILIGFQGLSNPKLKIGGASQYLMFWTFISEEFIRE